MSGCQETWDRVNIVWPTGFLGEHPALAVTIIVAQTDLRDRKHRGKGSPATAQDTLACAPVPWELDLCRLGGQDSALTSGTQVPNCSVHTVLPPAQQVKPLRSESSSKLFLPKEVANYHEPFHQRIEWYSHQVEPGHHQKVHK